MRRPATLESTAADELRIEFDRLIDLRLVSVVFQPVVDLASSQVRGFEALARGPHNSPFAMPTAMFRYAYQTGRAVELDWICRAAAFREALNAALPPDFTLFVNAEPAALRTECPPDLLETIRTGASQLNVVVELTERYLAHDPAAVLDAVTAARAEGSGIAIDDVGAEPASLAMMPLVHPDIIKLDLSLIQGSPDIAVARTVNGVLAEVERTGAIILAEGVETPEHADMALAMGATMAQGWRYGKPKPIADHWPRKRSPTLSLLPTEATSRATPYEVVTKQRSARIANRQLLRSLSRHLEYRAADPSEPGVLVACFQQAARFDDPIRTRYAKIAATAVMVAALGRDMPAEPAPHVRGTPLHPDDPLANEWAVIVVGAHFAAALVARHPPTDTAEPDDTTYEYAITYDRDLVIAAARSLMQRIESPKMPRT
ncbi:MAG TPA: EAL domain-containing protein [Micromonosporaceae bacterium]|nr:EAL domain-containing protein [Micromonosporaceae bacterium]